MSKSVLIFGGTTEGRELAQTLTKKGYEVYLSVATEYGAHVLADHAMFTLLEGRLTPEEMVEFLQENHFTFVVDATHPHATEVTQNIHLATTKTNTPYLRLIREKSTHDFGTWVSSTEDVVELLNQKRGNVLLTTGSKTLEVFTQVSDYKNRLYPRILPMVSSIQSCQDLGYLSSHILAIQGPFSTEMNEVFIKEYKIETMVTKDSGNTGGFSEKIEAAKRTGIDLIIIGRPEEIGYLYSELLSQIERRFAL